PDHLRRRGGKPNVTSEPIIASSARPVDTGVLTSAAAIALCSSFSQLPQFFMFVPLWSRTLTAPSPPRRREEDPKKTRRRKAAHQMPSPRWLATLTIPIMAAALVTDAAVAAADPINDTYLAQLRGLGFNWPPEHDGALIGMALLICDDLGWG